MKRLIPKLEGFTGKSVVIKPDRNYEISNSETLPEGFSFGVELPSEKGVYFISSVLGSFVLKISKEISILWSTRTGSYGDGTFRLNNSMGFENGGSLGIQEVVFTKDTLPSLPYEAYYDSLIDFGDYYVFGCMTRDIDTNTAIPYGVIKFPTDFSSYTLINSHLSDAEASIYTFDYILSRQFNGFLAFDTAEALLYYIDTDNEVSYSYPIPDADPVRYAGIMELPNNRFMIIGDNYTSVYRFKDLTLEHLGNFVHTEIPTQNGIGFGYHQMFNFKFDENTNTICIGDMQVSPTRRRIRAIDLSTYELLWEDDNTGTAVGGEGGSYIEEFVGILPNGNIVGTRGDNRVSGNLTYTVNEYRREDGQVVNTWDVTGIIEGDGNISYVDPDGFIYLQDYHKIYKLDSKVTDSVSITTFYEQPGYDMDARIPIIVDNDGTVLPHSYDNEVEIIDSSGYFFIREVDAQYNGNSNLSIIGNYVYWVHYSYSLDEFTVNRLEILPQV
jgi:hypothetical protein